MQPDHRAFDDHDVPIEVLKRGLMPLKMNATVVEQFGAPMPSLIAFKQGIGMTRKRGT